MGDEHQARLAPVRMPTACPIVLVTGAPLSQVTVSGFRQQFSVDGDGQPPVVRELEYGLRVSDRPLDGGEQGAVGLEPFHERRPGGKTQQLGGFHPAVLAGPLVLVQVQRVHAVVAQPGAQPPRVTQPPHRSPRGGVAQRAAHDSRHHDHGVMRDIR